MVERKPVKSAPRPVSTMDGERPEREEAGTLEELSEFGAKDEDAKSGIGSPAGVADSGIGR